MECLELAIRKEGSHGDLRWGWLEFWGMVMGLTGGEVGQL